MRSNTVRAGVAVALVALAVVLFIVLKDDDGGAGGETTPTTAGRTTGGANGQGNGDKATPPKPTVPTIVVQGGKPVGGVQELEFSKGDEIRFRVVSDVSDEVHVHGYDVSKEVAAGGSVGFDFAADIDGVYEVELEERMEPIIELRVNP